MSTKPERPKASHAIPAAMREKHDAIVAQINQFSMLT